jgi:chromosome segregation ATPase
MRYATLTKEIPHLDKFFTAHPELSDKIDTVLGIPLKLAEKYSKLNEELKKEEGEKSNLKESFSGEKEELSNLTKTLIDDAAHLNDLLDLYSEREPKFSNLDSFSKKGDWKGSLRNFLSNLAPVKDEVLKIDSLGVLAEVEKNFTQVEDLEKRLEKTGQGMEKESSDVEQFLNRNHDFLIVVRNILRTVCRMEFPDLMKELSMRRG